MSENGQKETTNKTGTEGQNNPEKNRGSSKKRRKIQNQVQKRIVPLSKSREHYK